MYKVLLYVSGLFLFVVINTSIVEHVDGLGSPTTTASLYKKVDENLNSHKTLLHKPKYTTSFKDLMKKINVPEDDWQFLHYIFYQESGFCMYKWEGQHNCPKEYTPEHNANQHVGYGLCQATPAIKYSQEGDDWRTNMYTQARWCYKYAKKYGSLAKAVEFKKCLGSCYSTRTNSVVYKQTPWF
jgi:hypothetical protein